MVRVVRERSRHRRCHLNREVRGRAGRCAHQRKGVAVSRIHRLSLFFSVVLAAGVAGSGMAQGSEMLYAPTTVLDGTLTAAPGT